MGFVGLGWDDFQLCHRLDCLLAIHPFTRKHQQRQNSCQTKTQLALSRPHTCNPCRSLSRVTEHTHSLVDPPAQKGVNKYLLEKV